MRRRLLGAAAGAWLALAIGPADPARAQYGITYPAGYGGWGGWGWGGAATPGGDIARGMGVFAAGVGQYNVQTAQARAINSQTYMQLNEYMWESQQIRNQRYYQELARRRRMINQGAEEVYRRLRDNPEAADIYSGDALNVALDQLTSPSVYLQSIKEAQTKIPSAMIRDIPFNKATDAITMSVNHLLNRDNWPVEIRTDPRLEKERNDLRAAVEQARKEDDEGDITPETRKQLLAAVQALQRKFYQIFPQDSPERVKGDPYIKALSGLIRMMDMPEIQGLLREVDKAPERTLADLLGFMHAFNLRFGVAETPRERAVYSELWNHLDKLRDSVTAKMGDVKTYADATAPKNPERVTEFFKAMPHEELQDRDVPPVPEGTPPPPPPPQP